jgi:hypothetical protein
MTEESGTAADDAVRHEEVLHAEGHEHVSGTHASTFEVTTDDYLTPAGDCIFGIEADRAPADFASAFVDACRDPATRIVTELSVPKDGALDDALVQRIVASGHPDLTFESDRSAVWRTSDYVDERTVAVGADGAAADLDRDLIAALATGAPLRVRIVAEAPA